MKQILISIFFFAALAVSYGQQVSAARATTDQLTAKYKLSASQAAKMYTIQERKFNGLSELEGIKSQNADLYRRKTSNLQRGTLTSIKSLLETPEQLKLFQQTQMSVRFKRSTVRQELEKTGASKSAIREAELAVYEE